MTKKFKTFKEQVKLIKSRGLIFENEEYEVCAEKLLNLISYYRLNSYRFPFLDKQDETKSKYRDCNKCFPDAWIALEAFDFGSLINTYSYLRL